MTMEKFELLAQAITWPIVALIAIVLAAVGFLNSPFKALGDSFGGLFRELRSLAQEIPRIEANLARLEGALNDLPSKIDERTGAVAEQLQGAFDERMNEMEKTLKARINDVVAPEFSAQDDGPESTDVLGNAASKGIAKIKDRWALLIERLRHIVPDADARQVGEVVRGLAKKKNPVFTPEIADDIANLHSGYKSFTRRQQYADEWLTQADVDWFVSEAERLKDAIPIS